jgi:WD40 repeat protein/tetratricopeptide (TPR) repeat protein
MAYDESERDDLLDRLVEEFAGRLRRGERPALKEYTDRYAELAEEIRELFPAMVEVEHAKEICHDWDEDAAERVSAAAPPPAQVGDYRIVREIGRGGMGVVYEAEQVSLGRRVALKVLPSPAVRDGTTLAWFRREARASARLHHTNIVPVFDVGQDGDIRYYAMQFIQGQSLDSVIRELRKLRGRSRLERGGSAAPGGPDDGRSDDPDTRAVGIESVVVRSLLTGRFAQVPTGIYAGDSPARGPVGPAPSGTVPPAAGDSSAVMPGGTQLSSVESRHRAFHRGVAHIGRQVASALAYAYTRGILHRDIKPSNLLLDTEGVVWVSDFGLAKVDEDDLTKTGDILGTLRYMAPERFRGRGDARADIYSLGLTLYELLALRPAFDSRDRVALSEQIKTLEPPRPRSIDPRIPRDFETIVLKAIEKDPGDRYAAADAMAEDLRRFLEDEPILARRAGAPERYLRWARRHPAVAILGGVLTALLIGVTIASVLVAGRMARLARANDLAAQSERQANRTTQAALAQAKADRFEADRQRKRAEQHLYIARIGQAESALRLYDDATARGLLDLCRPGPGESDRRGWEWSYLHQWCSPELKTIAMPTTTQPRCVAMSPDGRFLAVGCWAPNDWNSEVKIPGQFSPVPAYLISLPDGRVRHELAGHNLDVNGVAFRPDGRCLATLGYEGTIRLWNTGSGQPQKTISLGRQGVNSQRGLGWSPDGRRLAGVTRDGPVRIWDPETGRETARIARNAGSVAWSPDGTRIALGLVDNLGLEVRPWDDRAERLREPVLSQPGPLFALSWSPDSRRLAAAWSVDYQGSPTCRLTVLDAASGEGVFQVNNPGAVRSIAFSPDGTRVATSGESSVVRVCDAANGRQLVALFTGATQVSQLAFGPDGRRLYAAGWGMGGIKVFDPDRDPRGRYVRGWHDQNGALAFDREGLRVLEFGWMSNDLFSVDPVECTRRHEGVFAATMARGWPRGDFAFSRDGCRLAAPTQRDRTVVGVWDIPLERTIATLRGSGGPVTGVAFGPDGQVLATAATAGPESQTASTVTLCQIASGRPIRTFDAAPGPTVEGLAFSGDGRRLAAAGGTRFSAGRVTAWDVEKGTVLGTLDRVGYVNFLAFHPDGARLAIADFGEAKIHVWDLEAGTRITAPGPKGVGFVAFTPDGERLAMIGYDGDIHLADARTGDEILVLRGFGPPYGSGGFTPRLALSPDGSCLAASAQGGYLNIWDLGPLSGLAAEPEPGDVGGWLRRGRALAERGDARAAEAASARARDIKGRDGSPWIEHAVRLRRRGDSLGALDALARAMQALSDDPGRWLDLGRLLERLYWTEGLAMARPVLERRLALARDDEAAARVLAELLPAADAKARWTVLRPDVMTSAAGATLSRLPDGSVLAGGPNPPVDTYTVKASTDLPGITGLRLEVLPDPRLPNYGPGRSGTGNFILDGIRLTKIPEPGASVPVRLTQVRADYSQQDHGLHGVAGTLDQDPTTAWAIAPHFGRAHRAVFEIAEPVRTGPGTQLRVELVCGQTRFPYHALGRFRISVTDRPFPLFELTLMGIKGDTARNGLTRLAAAYSLLGEWAHAAAMPARAAARPDATALDDFLLALARHHLGRRDEARSECDRALGRLASDLADQATQDVAIEALMTILRLGVGEAEALLLDAAFPADPFAR